MSLTRKIRIACPQCGKESDFTVWQSLNAQLNPEAKQKLLEGTLFRFECEHCGTDTNVIYPMLYHDMDNHMLIYFVAPEDVESTVKMIVDMKDRGKYGEVYGVVSDVVSLQEKIVLLDNGLYDRTVEIMKLQIASDYEKIYGHEPTRILFNVVDGDKVFLLHGNEGKVYQVSFDMEQYNSIYSKTFRLPAVGHNMVIDRNWAKAVTAAL